MDFREYILGLFTIVSGLAVTEVAQRLARLIAMRGTVRWDVRPLIAAAVAVCTVAVSWSLAWAAMSRADAAHQSLGGFLVNLGSYLLLYITAASSLPADIQEGCDLGAFSARQGREFWTLYALTVAQWCVRAIVPGLMAGGLGPGGLAQAASTLVILAVAIALAIWRNRIWQAAGGLMVLAAIVGPNLFIRL